MLYHIQQKKCKEYQNKLVFKENRLVKLWVPTDIENMSRLMKKNVYVGEL